MKKKTNNFLGYTICMILGFAMFLVSIVGLHFAFPIDTTGYTKAEIQYLKDNNYLFDNPFEMIGHDVHNALLNIQDLTKGGE